MGNRIKIPTVGGSYQHDSKPFDSQLTINLFPERGGKQSKSPSILRRTPGLKLFVNIPGTGPIRGLYTTSGDRMFAVRNNALWEVSTAGLITSRGTLLSAYGTVKFTDYGTAMGIADGTSIYQYVLSTNVLTAVTDSSAPDTTPIVDMADGYVFGFDPDSTILGRFGHSNINDITTWNALDFYNAEGSPDKLIMLKVLNREVVLFGSKSFEVYYDRGGDNTGNNPTWARRPGTFKLIGCGAKYSVSVIGGKIFWLGASKDGENIIWTLDGYQPRRISTRALESQISTFTSVENAISFTYEYEGHYFYCLTFNEGNKTFVYDVTEGEWHNWAHRNTSTAIQQRHRAETHTFFNRINYVGDYANGNIYELSKTTYTDNSDPIVWERYFPYFDTMERRLSWFMLQIDALTGTGLNNNDYHPDGLSVTLTRTGTTVTASAVGGVAHGYATGDEVSISGAVPDGYNVKGTITVTTTSKFTYEVGDTSYKIPSAGTIETQVGVAGIVGTNTEFEDDPGVVDGVTLSWIDDAGATQTGVVLSVVNNTTIVLTAPVGTVTTANTFSYVVPAIDTPATGTILATNEKTLGSDPKIQIRWSDDGGRIFSNWHFMGLGKRGEYSTRVMKWMLGMSRDRVYHIRSSEPIPISIQDNTIAEVEASID